MDLLEEQFPQPPYPSRTFGKKFSLSSRVLLISRTQTNTQTEKQKL